MAVEIEKGCIAEYTREMPTDEEFSDPEKHIEYCKRGIREKREYLKRLIKEGLHREDPFFGLYCTDDYINYIDKLAKTDAAIKRGWWEIADEASDDVLYYYVIGCDIRCGMALLAILEDANV